ncbi:hypothetical protein DY000_02063660 [Brassica cretica]|uniref:YDG domain-containing protein n=1 Tax=Brassica cretica TaxID=69181 RepID=A0ABQ7B1X8_BRACR|nr:hypothetical protein DY000_02063660 [Brassica cretica]
MKIYQRGRTHIREEVEDYNHTMEGTCIDDDAGQRRGTVKDGYIISIIWIDDDDDHKREPDRYIGDQENRFRGDVAAGKVIRARSSEKV